MSTVGTQDGAMRRLLLYHTRLRNVGLFTSVAVGLVAASHVVRSDGRKRPVDHILLAAGLVFAATPVAIRFMIDGETGSTRGLERQYALLTTIVVVDAALALHVLQLLASRVSS